MSHRTRERPAECLASLSHSTMIDEQASRQSRWSPPPMDNRNSSGLSVSWEGVRYVMEVDQVRLGYRGSEPPELSLTSDQSSSVAQLQGLLKLQRKWHKTYLESAVADSLGPSKDITHRNLKER
ncbi:hypothetical protein EVAR_21519_1 [Eumeta japonica]|uniref:Uncharacterized protein n=1 Tax=Eumeta variegata TaxID=151549 RepID=A0A4C1UY87_EUMVA|nr:hypothetical protein EVAR_21519_1 [Eumeta japonica]